MGIFISSSEAKVLNSHVLKVELLFVPHAHLDVVNGPVEEHAADFTNRLGNGPLNGFRWQVVLLFVDMNSPIDTLFEIPACLVKIASHDVNFVP